MALTAKQQMFVAEYLIDLNATQAAIRAGYSKRTAEWQGPQLLGKTHVAATNPSTMVCRRIRQKQSAQPVTPTTVSMATVAQNKATELPVTPTP